ncbi:3-oxoacyl-[acyl-carrier-protein] synthase ii [Quercus suber]|uniref:beta-ketoacyl-[acyl-carrier-protein] synthase I n=1 Tax=Quercus suber TaxID=58331 RepID=A0AAW0LYR6_QUESU
MFASSSSSSSTSNPQGIEAQISVTEKQTLRTLVCLGHPSLNFLCNSWFCLGEAMAVAVQPSKEVATKKKPVAKQRRVVVTGMGVVTPLGHDPDVFYNNLLEGVSGVSEIEAFDCAQFPKISLLLALALQFILSIVTVLFLQRIAGEIKLFSTDGWVAPKLSKRMDKFMLYMLTAGKKALADGGITEDVMNELDKARCGVLIGSAMGGMKVFNDAIEALRISYKKMNPFCIPFATTNLGSAMLAMDLVNLLFFNFVIHLDGFTCDAYHMTEPHPDGAGVILCVEKALAQSGVSREDVNYINAHATSTPARDLKEYQALLQCFGQNPEVKVNSTKSMIGHLLGAAGAVEAVATMQVNNLCLDMVILNSRNIILAKFQIAPSNFDQNSI